MVETCVLSRVVVLQGVGNSFQCLSETTVNIYVLVSFENVVDVALLSVLSVLPLLDVPVLPPSEVVHSGSEVCC